MAPSYSDFSQITELMDIKRLYEEQEVQWRQRLSDKDDELEGLRHDVESFPLPPHRRIWTNGAARMRLLGNLVVAQAWHKTVLANSPFAYKTFADNFGNSPYAKVALNLHDQPKAIPLMQATHLIVSPQLAPQLVAAAAAEPLQIGVERLGQAQHCGHLVVTG